VRLGDRDVDFSGDDGEVVVRKIQKVVLHPKYKDDGSGYYDLAIIELDKVVDFGNYIRPVCLPSGSSDDPDIHESKLVVLTGKERMY